MPLREFLSEWQLRGSFLMSLFLQFLQILPANRRKSNSSMLITASLWLIYLATDKAATYGASVATRSISDRSSNINHELLSFWTPFLMLHLGGPDNITAFSLEDNQLWLRHALTLLSQGGFSLYIILRLWLDTGIRILLMLSTLCVLVAGSLKYAERTYALYRASMTGLRESMMSHKDPGPRYTDIMGSLSSKLNAGIADPEMQRGSSLVSSSSPSSPTSKTQRQQELLAAYGFFESFKCLFVELILTSEDLHNSLATFREKEATDAFRLVEFELSFAYDALYTKASMAHSLRGFIFRVVNAALVIAACLLFVLVDKRGFRQADVCITYLLLVGALLLELGSLAMFVFSDWTVILLTSCRPEWSISDLIRSRHKHWSETMKQHSLLSFCLQDQKTCFPKCIDKIKFKQQFDKYWFTACEPVPVELQNLIWSSLLGKVKDGDEVTDPYKSLAACRATLLEYFSELKRPEIKWSIEGALDEILLLWHVATDICYFLQDTDASDPRLKKEGAGKSELQTRREASKLISQYMLYLLTVHSTTLSSVAVIGLIRYRHTSDELIQFLEEEELVGHESPKNHKMLCSSRAHKMCSRYCHQPEKDRRVEVCENLLFMHTYEQPKRMKGDKSKSVLWDAVELARQLMKSEDKVSMWNTIARVWIELLCLAARNCRGDYHASLLNVGGELLTFVWLLEAHLGLGDYFEKPVKTENQRPVET